MELNYAGVAPVIKLKKGDDLIMGKLDGKVCLITGCASGLGKQEALRFAAEGAKLVICDIQEDKLEETKKLCEEKGAECITVKVDLTSREDRENFVQVAADKYGTIDVLVNNAHLTTPLLPILGKTLEDLELEYKVCIEAYFHLMQLCWPYMEDHPGYGSSIINFGSKAAREGTIGHGVYATVKAAVGGLTRVAAREFGPSNIRVNCVMPNGLTENAIEGLKEQTPEIQEWAKEAFKDNPFQRPGDPYEDLAPVVVFLASDDSHWITGATIHADGGVYISD